MEPSSDAPAFELDRFELVLLKRPAAPSFVSDEEVDRLQDLHLAYLRGLTASGEIRVCGPFDEQRDETFRRMAIYQTGSLERTRVDVMYFYCPRGSI